MLTFIFNHIACPRTAIEGELRDVLNDLGLCFGGECDVPLGEAKFALNRVVNPLLKSCWLCVHLAWIQATYS